MFGVGPPADYDLHKAGNWNLTFRPLGDSRNLEEGEEFVEIPAPHDIGTTRISN